ncbi:type II toxin-antitoxin system PemK/MazF family toxin [Cyanobium sp. ATX 6F1]|uniref:type II toxin-antitoxin system PemK/MazF family toxin n=1 Tax=unclassified Cyanobium TaxID=2627006 RepID=UPI0020CC286B|nr:type II toxin-antitoxin system PemK/MazF family toxin [Cyanobium sp. ATX 6F1]MCP9917563.1 type II toxin-antitoxin system PemK/MazF family toxin [Cyanobium sp. ATX 6F1]
MKRSEIWTVAGGGAYTSKPRPAVIVQDDAFAERDSITLCPLTTDPADAPVFRIPVEPSSRNGLSSRSWLMADKLSTVPRERLGSRIGQLEDDLLLRLNRSILVFLGLAR